MCWWVLSGPVTLHLWVIVWKSTASLRLSCFSLLKKVQLQPWHSLAMEWLTAIINVILIQVGFLMTMLYVKTSCNLLTTFESMLDSFSTRPEGKIPTSRQVFKALFTLYYHTLLFEWLWWFYGYLIWTKRENLILSKRVHVRERGKDKEYFFWNWSLKWLCFKHSYLQWKSFPHSQSKAYSSQWLLDLCHLQLWQTNKTNCYQL